MNAPGSDPAAEAVIARPAEAPAGTAPLRRPTGSPWRRALAAVFVHDLALKGLALLLAVLTWQLVREQISTTVEFSDVQVEVTGVPVDVALVRPQDLRVKFELQGSRSEIERARALLDAERKVQGTLRELPSGVEQGSTTIDRVGDFTFPFERPDLVRNMGSVRIDWVRLVERTVPLVPPEVDLKPGTPLEPAPGFPTLETPRVRLRGPRSVLDGLASLRPDPIDASAWLDTNPDLLALYPWSSGFESWRGNDPLRGPKVLSIEPETAKGKLKLRPVAAPRAVEHELRLVLPPGPAEAFSHWDVRIEGGPEYDRASRKVRLTLRGDKRVLDEMEANPDGWSYVVEVPPPSETGEPVENVRVPVRLFLGVAPSTGKPLGVGVTVDGAPVVLVSLKRRP